MVFGKNISTISVQRKPRAMKRLCTHTCVYVSIYSLNVFMIVFLLKIQVHFWILFLVLRYSSTVVDRHSRRCKAREKRLFPHKKSSYLFNPLEKYISFVRTYLGHMFPKQQRRKLTTRRICLDGNLTMVVTEKKRKLIWEKTI